MAVFPVDGNLSYLRLTCALRTASQQIFTT